MNINIAQIGYKKLTIVSVIFLLLLISLIVLRYFQMQETESQTTWVRHTLEVIAKLEKLDAISYEMGNAQKAFIITSDPAYRKIFRETSALMHRSITQHEFTVKDNPEQVKNFNQLSAMVNELEQYYDNSMDMLLKGQKDEVTAIVRSGKGHDLLYSITNKITEMKDLESSLLKKRLANEKVGRQKSQTVFLIGSLFIIVCLLIFLYVAYNETSRREKIQRELNHSTQIQRAISHAAAFAFIVCDKHGAITHFNPASEKLLGYGSAEIMGKSPAMFHDSEEIVQMASKLSKRFNEIVPVGFNVFTHRADRGIVESDNWIYIRKDGERVPVKLTVTSLRNEEGEITGYMGIAYDITEQNKFEHELIVAKEQALAGTQAKSEFLANMSHEIRTPMNAIIGMSEVLQESPLSDDQKRFVSIIQNAGGALLSLINDILDFSKIESGYFELDKAPFNLREVVNKATDIISMKAQQKQLNLKVEFEEGLHQCYVGDANRLRQVLLNLLGNAVKFTRKGEVLLKVREVNGEIEIEISDTGIGMSPAHLENLFKRFSQADTLITREFGGTGLGLSISKKLVDLMDGSIEVQSTLGVGSRFFVRLKLPKDFEGEKVLKEAVPLKPIVPKDVAKSTDVKTGLKILLVDDNEDNRMVIISFLKSQNADIHQATNGEEALKLFFQNRYDLILMDMQMPVMDGYTAVSEIRKYENHNQLEFTPVIGLSAYALKEEIDKSFVAGCNGYITKPVPKDLLLQSIAHYTATIPLVLSKDVEDLMDGYLKNRQAEIVKFKDALNAEDFKTVQVIGHKLLGSAGSYGLAKLSAIGKDIEDKAKAKDKPGLIMSLSDYQTYLKLIQISYS